MPVACTVIVSLTPLSGHYADVMALLDQVVPEIRGGRGCLRYDVFEEARGRIVLIEEWESREHWQAHFSWDPILVLKRELASWVEMPVERREMYERNPGGTP